MPTLSTSNVQPVGTEEEQVIVFPLGLPGFEEIRRFRLLSPAERAPLVFLQSLETLDLCFVCAPLLVVDPGYRLAVSEEDLRIVTDFAEDEAATSLEAYAVLTIEENGGASANLLAPILLNRDKKVAVQAVRGDQLYSHAVPLRGGGEDRC